jgi:hypothetical protein
MPLKPSDQFEFELERKRLAALAEQTLRLRRSAEEQLDELICALVGQNANTGCGEFKTPGGRRCGILITIGDDVTDMLVKFAQQVIKTEDNK